MIKASLSTFFLFLGYLVWLPTGAAYPECNVQYPDEYVFDKDDDRFYMGDVKRPEKQPCEGPHYNPRGYTQPNGGPVVFSITRLTLAAVTKKPPT